MPFDVVLIGLNEYDNLGLGYISAVLKENGFGTKILNLKFRYSAICRIVRKINPSIVGFSIIYSQNIDKFDDLINQLRYEGINCHFTCGGHYPSLRYKELLGKIPALDSVVRFEGENTMLKLCRNIKAVEEWKGIKGIAYREGDIIKSNPLRPFEPDLDIFPFPLRSPLKEYAYWKKFATIIAGRGCIHNCSFCNTRIFYSQPPGQIKRIRMPEKVVKEMIMLYKKKNCEVFLFLDDDFPVKPLNDKDWVRRFCSELVRSGLDRKVIWKINCRPDEVDGKLFLYLKKHGLFSVFLGIEDGTTEGLKKMNKMTSPEVVLKAVRIIKKLKIKMDIGFILFHPDTTFKSLRLNLEFLREICGDGYSPISFYKMIPYYETQIEKELRKSGRLIETKEGADYNFPDIAMDAYHSYIISCFSDWLYSPAGVENTSRWAGDYISVYRHYFYIHSRAAYYIRKARKVIMESNLFLIRTMIDLSGFFEEGQYLKDNGSLLESYRQGVHEHSVFYSEQVKGIIADMIDYTQYQYIGNLFKGSEIGK